MIKKVKEALEIPVIANGGMATYEDCIKCLEYTGCDGVMSSEAILEYPALFDGSKILDIDDLALEYLQMVDKYPGESDLKSVRSHCHKFLHTGLKIHVDLRTKLAESKSLEEV
jgi:tRNA-dihydrouridine synthase